MNASDGGCQYLTIQNAEQVELPRGRSAVTRTLCKITRHANGIAGRVTGSRLWRDSR